MSIYRRELTLDEIIYWGTLCFVATTVGFLLVTLIATASREDTAFMGSTYMRKQARYAAIETNYGTITVVFNRSQAPTTVNNFVSLAQAGFYDKTKFHRVVKGLLIQGGDPLSRENDRDLYGTGGPGYVFEDEIHGLKLERGAVAMSNLGRPRTNGSQFFILTARSASYMDDKYTIFGKVIEGMSVVDEISAIPVDDRSIPKEDVIVERITLD
jgi:cyclophilin family peptidyl-prolyl cis-trans isomerase